jgi:transposase
LKIFEFNRKAIAKGWEIRHLEPSNQDKWLNQIPDNDGILHSEYFKDTWPTRRSDLVRLMVTKHFGGLYIDYTVVLT